jgi:hypothetical protein
VSFEAIASTSPLPSASGCAAGGAVELRNIGPSDLALGVIDREDRRPVLRTRVWPVPIELGRVIGYRQLVVQI